jgi:hypothetical protein
MTQQAKEILGAGGQARRHGLNMPTLIGIGIIVLTFTTIAFPTMIVVLVGMIPTLVCFIVDMTPGRYAFRCVAAMNLAGVAPYIRILWTQGHDMSTAMTIIADPFAWLVFYGTAAFGWGFFFSVPGVVSAVQTLSAERRVNKLRVRQNELAEEWGAEITGENWAPHDLSVPMETTVTS